MRISTTTSCAACCGAILPWTRYAFRTAVCVDRTTREGRLLASHDVSRLTAYAYARVKAGESMPGLVEVGQDVSIAGAIEDLLLIATCSQPGEWEGQILYLPLR